MNTILNTLLILYCAGAIYYVIVLFIKIWNEDVGK